MKQSKNDFNQYALSGYIQSIPLIIEDKETKKIIKKASLYLHSSPGTKVENSNVTNISLTAMNQEGSFHVNITKDNCLKFKRKGHFTSAEWESVIQHLFPINEYNQSSIADNLVASAKFISRELYYDSDTHELLDDDELPLVSEFITIDIKTNAKLPITVGSINLPYTDRETDLEASDMIRKEQNLFNWLDLLLLNNEKLYKELDASRQANSLLKEENEHYKNELETSAIQHKKIIDDFLDKFYQVLNTKKDRIWELEDKSMNRLEGLNENYINQNKFNLKNYTIDKNEIPDELDVVYTSPTKRKRASDGSLAKGRKKKTKAKDSKEISDDKDTNETQKHPLTISQDKSDHLVTDTKGLSDKEIVTSIFDRGNVTPTTDVDQLLHLSNDGSSESHNVTDYSDEDDNYSYENTATNSNDTNAVTAGDNKRTTEEQKSLQSNTLKSNDTANSTSDAVKEDTITDYDSNSDSSQKSPHQKLNSDTDEIADSLQ